MKGPLNKVISFLNGLISKVEETINTIINGVNSALTIDIPRFAWDFYNPFTGSLIGSIGFPGYNWSPNIPNVQWGRIQKLAQGGTVRDGQQAIVGEYAPEYLRVVNGQAIVTPMGGGRFNDNGGSTVTNNITINQRPGESSEQLARRVSEVLTRWEVQRRAAFGT